MADPSELRTIRAYAGAGALTTAWRLFRAGGYEAEASGAALSTKGRLLKEQALAAAPGPARRRLFLQAAEAYGQAGEAGRSYAMINVATLWRLAGRVEEARSRAEAVLTLLDANAAAGRDDDTGYYLAASRAEALLLLGRVAAARQALEAAVGTTPQGWEDHAPTLRQFRLILEAMGETAGWLEALRPPRTMHFAGHMGLAPRGEALATAVREVIDREQVGFGYGALAAGADIVVAEALLAAGADLHLVLPGPGPAFRAASVARSGEGWAARFDAVLERARSIRALDAPTSPAHPLAVQAASEIAMGRAALQAREYATEAIQLVVLEHAGETGPRASSAWAAGVWRRSGRRQAILTAARGAEASPAAPAGPSSSRTLAAVLAIQIEAVGDPVQGPKLARAAALALRAAGPPIGRAHWEGGTLYAAYGKAVPAARAAVAVSAALGPAAAVGGHYGVFLSMRDADGETQLLGDAAQTAKAFALRAGAGLVDFSEDLAAAVQAFDPGSRLVRIPGAGPQLSAGEEPPVYGLAV